MGALLIYMRRLVLTVYANAPVVQEMNHYFVLS